jgi:hypothetical protein
MSVGQMSVVHLPLEHNSRHLKMTKSKYDCGKGLGKVNILLIPDKQMSLSFWSIA